MILAKGIHIDEILYSPLVRAEDTAKHVLEITRIPLREELRLKEQYFGRFESTPRDWADFQEAKTHFVDHFEGGESMLQMAQRIYNLLDDMSNEDYACFGIKNCEIKRYNYR